LLFDIMKLGMTGDMEDIWKKNVPVTRAFLANVDHMTQRWKLNDYFAQGQST
jgi:hypothetical protein